MALTTIFSAAKEIDQKTMALQYLDMMKTLGSNNSTKYVIPMEFTEMFRPFTETLRAASAGSYIALSSNYVYMGNSSFIGPSKPYIIGGTALEEQHVTNASYSFMESLAQTHGWNQSAVYQMVENNVAYTAQNASRIGLVSGLSDKSDGEEEPPDGRYENCNVYARYV